MKTTNEASNDNHYQYGKPRKQEHTSLNKQTEYVLINEVLMTFSGFGSYRKDTCYYDEYIFILSFHFQFFRHGSPSVKEKLFYRGPCI